MRSGGIPALLRLDEDDDGGPLRAAMSSASAALVGVVPGIGYLRLETGRVDGAPVKLRQQRASRSGVPMIGEKVRRIR
jgi:hypothetical protein